MGVDEVIGAWSAVAGEREQKCVYILSKGDEVDVAGEFLAQCPVQLCHRLVRIDVVDLRCASGQHRGKRLIRTGCPFDAAAGSEAVCGKSLATAPFLLGTASCWDRVCHNL